ncbi:hypothetical protein ACGVWS_02890 [Enterobacteriaceae bacterium LUAb1]
MKKSLFFSFLFFFFLSGSSWSSSTYPKDLNEFFKIADECQYLAGEWDSTLPEARKTEIEKNINITCDKARSLQKKVGEKYKSDKQMTEKIKGYDF